MIRYFLSLFFLITSCRHLDQNDPLKNTKKLTTEGHVSLYKNGAFQIPSTKIKIVPEGPAPLDLATELSGASAQSSFLAALSDAKDSVKIVVDGTKMSYQVGHNAWDVSQAMSEKISRESKTSGLWIIENSSELSKKIYGKTFELPAETKKRIFEYSQSLIQSGQLKGQSASDILDNGSMALKNKLVQTTDDAVSSLQKNSKDMWNEGKRSFVHGYIALPEKLSQNLKNSSDAMTLKKYSEKFASSEEKRENWSENMRLIVSDTIRDYPVDVASGFKKASTEFENSADTVGLSLAVLKAAGWVVYSLVWDGGLKPLARLGSAGVGYVFINGVTYPAMIVGDAGIETGSIVVEVIKDTGKSGIEIIAPTGQAALATLLSGTAWSASAITNVAGNGLAYGVRGAGSAAAPVAKYGIQGTALGVGKTIEYVGIPLTQAGIYTGGSVSGVMVDGGGLVAGKAVDWTGQAFSGLGKVAGGITASTVTTVGAVGSAGLGVLNGLYQVGKATVVPSAKILGGAVVLSYGTLAQLSAHTILAAADASYLVLSMEGPSFVIYSIKGLVSKGDNLPTNAVLNLNELRNQGEIIKKIPVSEAEMKKVIQEIEKEHGVQN